MDGHHSMNVYINAMLQCWQTLKQKFASRYPSQPVPNYSSFAYFCFHTPFSKMVQKSFFALLLHEMQANSNLFPPGLVETCK